MNKYSDHFNDDCIDCADLDKCENLREELK